MKTAFMFPGQGSQSKGMLSDLAEKYPSLLNTFQEASEVLGYDLWDLCQQGDESELNRTEVTQPAILTASIALWRLWGELGAARPDYLAGHSLGEYSALVAAGSLEFSAAVGLVRERGRLMQGAVAEGVGKMAAVIGLDDDLVVAACSEAAEGQVVEAVNFNSPGQVVIAGNAEAVERAAAACKEKGARRVLPLPVSVPSHCALMKPAAEQLAVTLEKVTVQAPVIPVLQNVTAQIVTDPAQIRDNLVKQLYSPVLWTQTLKAMAGLGVEKVVECGPGKVLVGLAKRTLENAQGLATATSKDFEDSFEQVGSGDSA